MGSVLPSIIPVALGVVSNTQKQSNVQKQAEVQQQQVVQQQQSDEDKRQRALKAALATRRARYGASGIDVNDGSAEAVLLGMFSQSEVEFQDRINRDNLRLQAISQTAQSASSRNLLSLTSDVFDNSFTSTFLT